MKRNICVFFAFLFFSAIVVAEVQGKNGTSAEAEYIGDSRELHGMNFRSFAVQVKDKEFSGVRNVTEVRKLSKEQISLLWSALGEYDFSNGEIYGVSLINGGECTYIVVEVVDKRKKQMNWCAWSASTLSVLGSVAGEFLQGLFE